MSASLPMSLAEALISTGSIVKQSDYTRLDRVGTTEYTHKGYSNYAFSPTLYGGDRDAAVAMAEAFLALMEPYGAHKTGRFEERLDITVPHRSR